MTYQSTETWALRDALRDALSPRVPRTAPDLFRRVVNDWGHVDERRLWNYLSWLLQRGIAVRLAPPHYNQRQLAGETDLGYLRGTGIEYPQDATDREWAALKANGRCPSCFEPLEEVRPKWMRSALCMDCYRTTQNDRRFWLRRAAGARMRGVV